MHRFGGYQANCTFLIDRLDLLQQFGAIAAGETHQREIQRRQRLVASLMPRKTIRVATDVWERKLTELPQEPVLGPESWRLSSKTPINSLGSCLNSLKPSITTMSGLSPWLPVLSLFHSQLVEKLVPDRGFF